MTKIVEITHRLEIEKRKKQAKLYGEKIRAIQRIVRCGSCHLKCSMCGRYLREEELGVSECSRELEIALCPTCRGEFEDFKRISQNPGEPHLFWQKKAWLRVWQSWISFQKALKEFRESEEFKVLITEFDE